MHKVILPFKLSSSSDKKAVSTATFSVDSNIQQFSSIQVARLRFMKHYEQEKFTLNNIPFTEFWGDIKLSLTTARAAASIGGGEPFRSTIFGHPSNYELRSLDDLPNIIEIGITSLSKRVDGNSLFKDSLGEYQSVDDTKDKILDNNTKLQSILVYNTDLKNPKDSSAYIGSIACDMSNLGSFDIRNKGFSETFTFEMSMYNFRGLALDNVPSVELTLLFR